MKNEDVLTEVDRRFADQREFINAKITHLSAVVRDGYGQASDERQEIIKHQITTNGRVTNLENETRFVRWCNKRPYFAVPLIVLILFGVIAIASYLGPDILFKLL